MTEKQVFELLKSTDLPVAYHHFEEGDSPEPPFLVYLYPESRNVSADNRVYKRIQLLHVELYTDKKDVMAERTVEAVLDEASLFWQKSETWIESEKMYEVLYEMEVIIHE